MRIAGGAWVIKRLLSCMCAEYKRIGSVGVVRVIGQSLMVNRIYSVLRIGHNA